MPMIDPDDLKRSRLVGVFAISAAVLGLALFGTWYFEGRIPRTSVENYSGIINVIAWAIGVLILGLFLHRLNRFGHKTVINQQLFEAIESVPVGVALYDPEDRLVLWNRHYVDISSLLSVHLKPGMTFGEIARESAKAGNIPAATADPESWIRERLKRHGNPSGQFDLKVSDGWVRIWEHRTDDGSILVFTHDITTAKQAETEAIEKQALLETIIEHVPHAIFWKDTNGVYVGCNRNFIHQRGFTSPDAIIGRNLHDFAGTQEEADTATSDDRRVLTTGETILDREETVTRPDGSTSSIISSKVPLRDREGRIVGVLGVFADVSAQKRLEQELRESEERLSTIIEHSPAAIFLKDLEGRYVVANEVFTGRYGVHTDDLIGKTMYELLSKEDADRLAEIDRRVIAGGKSTMDEVEVTHADGLVHTHLNTDFPIFDGDGKVVGLGGISTDITERKQVEREMEAQRLLLDTIIETIPHGIFWKDRDLRYVGGNSIAARNWGLDRREELIGKTVPELAPSREEAERIDATDRSVIDEGKTLVNFEHTHARDDGTTTTHLSSKLPLRDADGNIAGLLGIFLDITERKQAEELLRESEARMRLLFENASIGIGIERPDGATIQGNPLLANMLGYTPEEILNMRFTDYTHPDDAAVDAAMFEEMVQGKRDSYQMEKRYFRKDGSLAWGRLTRSKFFGEDGQLKYCLGMTEDITARKAAEAALAESEALIRLTLNTVPDLVWVKDVDGRYIACNPTFERFFGAAEAEILGKTDYDFVDTELADFFRKYDKGAMDADQPLRNEEWITFADDGHEALLETTKTPLRDSNGKVIGVLGIGRDITERKRAEDALSEQENLLRGIMQSAQDAITLTDENSKVVFWNAAAAKLTGYSEEEALGKNVLDLIVLPSFHAEAIEGMEALRLGKDNIYADQQTVGLLRKDGQEFVADLSLARLLRNGVWHFVGIFRDATQRVAAEQQLRQAQRVRSLGSLAGGVAHELNNLLLPILTLGGMLKRQFPEETTEHQKLIRIVEAAERAKDLVAQIMDFSRQEEEDRGPIDFGEVIERGLRTVRTALPTSIIIKSKVDANVGMVNANPRQIETVLMNLAANAAESYGGKPGKIEISLTAVDVDPNLMAVVQGLDAKRYAKLAVADKGIGMDDETRERAFDPFFTTKEVGEGTGLGLSVAHSIVSAHQGAIRIASERGRGTIVDVYFPLIEDGTLG